MNGHLPECNYTPEYFVPEDNILWRGEPCMCEQLRACEQRVMQDAKEWEANAYIIGLRVGTDVALNAAEEAVADVPCIDMYMSLIDKSDVLAAIRGLRTGGANV